MRYSSPSPAPLSSSSPVRAPAPSPVSPQTPSPARTGPLPSLELIQRYHKPGPRYTSYPTAPNWHDDYTIADYEQAIATYAENPQPAAVYVHIPFCESLCFYCGCHVYITRSQDTVARYLEALRREAHRLRDLAGRRIPAQSLHWGGGTPTYLSVAQIEQLYSALSEGFDFSEAGEVALEVDPRVTTPEQLRVLRQLGFNRLSMGVQDFDPHVQAIVNRQQPAELTRSLVDEARALAMESVSIDLMYGLPDQTLANFMRTLDEVLRIRPDRLALFGYAHVPWLKKHQRVLEKYSLPDAQARWQLYAAATEKLTAAGYVAIGLDHFALPHDQMVKMLDRGRLHRNFMGYTTQASETLFGLGASAIGNVGDHYVQNQRNALAYMNAVERNGLAAARGIMLSPDDLIRRAVINRFMCELHLVIPEIEQKFEIDFADYFAPELAELEQLADDGLLTWDCAARLWQLTDLGRMLVRNVCMVFDRYLRSEALDKGPRYSQTI